MRFNLRLLGASISAMLVLACGGGGKGSGPTTPEPVEPPRVEAWRQDRGDLLNWFLGHRPESTRTLLTNNPSWPLRTLGLEWDGTAVSGDAHWTKTYTEGRRGWEHYRWDAQWVYLVEDHSGNKDVNYTFSKGQWFPRRFRVGDRGRASGNQITWLNDACEAGKTYRFEYEWSIVAQGRMDFGGVVGVQDYILFDYIWGPDPSSTEHYYLTWDWGWIRHANTKHDWTVNTPAGFTPPGADCV